VSLLALNGLRVSEATGADIDRLGIERGHRTLTTLRKGGMIVTIPLAPARPGRSIWRSASASTVRSSSGRTARASIGTPPGGSYGGWPDGPVSPRRSNRTPSDMRSSPRPSFDAGVPLRDLQEAASHADSRTTMRYDRARVSLDRHATYIVAAFLGGAAR
jgi:integrase/recombinase XerD